MNMQFSMRILADWSEVRTPVKKLVLRVPSSSQYVRTPKRTKVAARPKKRTGRTPTVVRQRYFHRGVALERSLCAPYSFDGKQNGRGHTACMLHSDNAAMFFGQNKAN